MLIHDPELGLRRTRRFVDPNIAQKRNEVPPAGGSVTESKSQQPPPKLSDSQDDSGPEKKEGEEGGGQSESLVRGSYLPANKLQDAPPASEYEGPCSL